MLWLSVLVISCQLTMHSHAYNDVLEKYDLQKAKRIENKLDTLISHVQELTNDVTSLKKINKKLYRGLHSGGGSIALKALHGTKDGKAWHTLSQITGPLKSSHLTKKCPGVFELTSHSSCYHIESERVTWPEARTMCMTLGADLVSIETQSEQNYIQEHLKQSKIYRHCDIWTSGTDAGHEGRWTWTTTRGPTTPSAGGSSHRRLSSPAGQTPITYMHWQRDEPNNGGGVENCLWMDWFFGWRWNDAKCNTDRACFICEKKI